jgi:hypothetical protein
MLSDDRRVADLYRVVNHYALTYPSKYVVVLSQQYQSYLRILHARSLSDSISPISKSVSIFLNLY